MNTYIYIYICKVEQFIKNNYNNNNRFPGLARGGGRGENKRFQPSASTHSGAGEKETPNINVVGKNKTTKYYCALKPIESGGGAK